MNARRGMDLTLKVDITGQGDFTTVATVTKRLISFKPLTAEVASSELASGWREASGTWRTVRIGGEAAFVSCASEKAVRAYFSNSLVMAWQAIVPDFGIIEGLFLIETLEFAAQNEDERHFCLWLQSAGKMTFLAAQIAPDAQ